MENLIKKIEKEKINCYFLSPHLDDAVLSAGGLMSRLTKRTNVTVINIFTKAGRKSTLSAQKSTQRAGFSSANSYYKERVVEDSIVMKRMGVNVVNLGFSEALWRKKYSQNFLEKFLSTFLTEFSVMYPIYRLNIIGKKIAKQDVKTVDLIKNKLSFIEKNAYVFAPLAVGGHVDHTLTFKSSEDFHNVIYWSDFPYNMIDIERAAKGKRYVFKTDWDAKEKLVKLYKTQFDLLFPSGKMPKKNEVFFTNL